jgi:hypothetical protein
MLPYQLRPPAVKGKQPYANGGPVEQAIYNDLVQMREKYVQDLNAQVKPSGAVDDKPGVAFGVFKNVFRTAKVAMLHTRLAPKRCDRSAFSQLAYAACWTLLQDSFAILSNEECFNWVHASCSVFALYAIYETNPLPTGRTTDETEILSMLPTRINQNRETLGFLFRRHFKQPIRVDMDHFYYLQRLQQLAMAKESECRAIMSTSSPPLCPEHTVVADIVHIVRRLLPALQCCSYTGPCSLEGLAGHEKYMLHPLATTSASIARTTSASSSVMDEDGQRNGKLSLTDVQVQLESYLESCRAIRFPTNATKRTKRIRQALEPIISNIDGHDNPLALICARNGSIPVGPKRVKLRHVTFEVGVATDNGDIHDSLTTSVVIASPDDHALSNPSFDLFLPEELTPHQEMSLQSAVETVLSRDPTLLLSQVEQAPEPDGVSTLGPDGASVASTAVSGAGQKALDNLFGMLTGRPTGMSAAESFLGGDEDVFERPLRMKPWEARKDGDDDDDVDDDLSEISLEEEEISVAVSAAGRKALGVLLNKCSATKSRRLASAETDYADPKTMAIEASRRNSKAQSSSRYEATTRQRIAHEESARNESEDDSVSVMSESAHQGKLAISALLSMAKHR